MNIRIMNKDTVVAVSEERDNNIYIVALPDKQATELPYELFGIPQGLFGSRCCTKREVTIEEFNKWMKYRMAPYNGKINPTDEERAAFIEESKKKKVFKSMYCFSVEIEEWTPNKWETNV